LAEAVFGEPDENRPPNLAAVGIALRNALPLLLDRFSGRLRSDPLVSTPAKLTESDLLDHTSASLADIADTLVSLETAPATAEVLLRDGSEIQRLIADLHGRQRARLGWSNEVLGREWEILVEEVEKAVRSAFTQDGAEIEGAVRLLQRILDRGERISRRSMQHTRAIGSTAGGE
jgi:hypothetical protein